VFSRGTNYAVLQLRSGDAAAPAGGRPTSTLTWRSVKMDPKSEQISMFKSIL